MSLPSLIWMRDLAYRIRLDPPKGAPFPFPHCPSGPPPRLRVGPLPPEPDKHLFISPNTSSDGTTLSSDLADPPTSPRADQDTYDDHTLDLLLTGDGLKFLTINVQKAEANNPSLVDIVTILVRHSPDFLFLTETPMHPHNGALIHALRDRDYIIHHHLSNVWFKPDDLPEARLPDHMIRSDGGCWLAYKKHTSWTPMVSPLTLPRLAPMQQHAR